MTTIKLTYWSKLVIATASIVAISAISSISSALALSLSSLNTSKLSHSSERQVLADKYEAYKEKVRDFGNLRD